MIVEQSNRCPGRRPLTSLRTSPGNSQATPALATWHRYSVLPASRAQAFSVTLTNGLCLDLSFRLCSGCRRSSADQAPSPDRRSSLPWNRHQRRTMHRDIKEAASSLLPNCCPTVLHRHNEQHIDRQYLVQAHQRCTGLLRRHIEHLPMPSQIKGLLTIHRSNIAWITHHSTPSTYIHSIRDQTALMESNHPSTTPRPKAKVNHNTVQHRQATPRQAATTPKVRSRPPPHQHHPMHSVAFRKCRP